MERRSFLNKATVGATAGAIVGAPAIVRAQPAIRWRLASSFPKSLDTLFGTVEHVVQRVGQITGGKFQISVHAAGEIVPPLQVLDAAQAGTIELAHTALYYFFGKEPSWSLACAIPFGLNCRQYNSWWHYGGGGKLFNEFANKAAGVQAFLCGNTGAQMGGFFRKEINTVEDLKGLKFRIAGMAGQMLAKLGVVPQQLPAGDIYSSLEKGAIDAAEWTVPYDDEKLGLHKVAKYYYYPGFWEGGPALHVIGSQKALATLPPEYRAALEVACEEGNSLMMAKYDFLNPPALKKMIGTGAVLKAFPRPVMEAAFKAAQEVYAETSAKSADFKKLSDHYFAYQRELVPWFRVNENTFDDFMATIRR